MISTKVNHGLSGNPRIPGDKSISHRSIIIPAISNGVCEIKNYLRSDDVINTLDAFKSMGVEVVEKENKLKINGKGLNSLKQPNKEIYLGNSGTSARLLTGLLSSQNFETILTGDGSLSSRPMKRIIDPLVKMNAEITSNNGRMPLLIKGQELSNTEIEIKIPSAQIKSGVILAALNTKGITKIIEHHITRDHTEIMLDAFDADIKITNQSSHRTIEINGKKELNPKNIEVPSDLSSSAFFIVAALINKKSKITLKNININPTRNGILIALEKMGAKISYHNKRFLNNELVSDIEVVSSDLIGCELDGDIAKLMIDEYPILSIAASFANSPSIFKDLGELRVKESDRLNLIKVNLLKCGVNCKVVGDDLHIIPNKEYNVNDNIIQTDFDHRISMAFAIMGSKIGPLEISDADSINTSFPNFLYEFNKIGGNISWIKLL